MPPNDVVKHDLSDLLSTDWPDTLEPIPITSASGLALPDVKPPVTGMINAPAIDMAPYRSIGKMALRFDDTSSKGASGWVVAPKAFITAGHCVYHPDYGGWISAARFCPRYNLSCDTKNYVVKAVYTLQGWIDNKDPDDRAYDLAACVVTEAFTEDEPPLAFDVSPLPALKFAAIGYPITPIPAHQFNGKRMWDSQGDMVKAERSMLWAENDLTGGASGGPWCEPDNNWVVSGLTSYRSDDDQNVAISPVFGQGFRNLYDAVKNL